MYIHRHLEEVLKKAMFSHKVIILFGPRQVGKTTLVKKITTEYGKDVRYVDCELLENRELLTRRATQELFEFVRKYKIVVFDEAQVIPNIGSILKILYDHHPEVQYIATGSSSFDLANEVSEPLTGRSLEFTLFPLGLTELADHTFDAEQVLPSLMRFGGYPELARLNEQEKIFHLKTIVSQYLYKNVLAVGGVKKPEVITHLLKLLAYQIGNEVSYRELAQQLGTSAQTIERYIDLLEKNFVIIRLSSFSRNLRNEVTRSKKVYFVDLGIRNALIDAFHPIDTVSRPDVGVLFENCMIIERLKHAVNVGRLLPSRYFWRTVSQQEIDYIEERDVNLFATEFKWSLSKVVSPPKAFTNAYPNAHFSSVSPVSAYKFVTE